ncbi:MAG: hypothetical protein IPP40_14885 [bacterium]|nr:hypothetical protein [bacterium]
MTFTDVISPDFQGSEYKVVAWGDVDGNGYVDLSGFRDYIMRKSHVLNNGLGFE